MSPNLLEAARLASDLTQEELASDAGTSRPTISAYESGRKSPTLATAERILHVAGFALSLEPLIDFREVTPARGRPFHVPNRLWRLPTESALASVELPLTLNWSDPGRVYNLRHRMERARCYEVIIREGMPDDIQRWIDGALLIDIWDDLTLPRYIRKEWNSVTGLISQ